MTSRRLGSAMSRRDTLVAGALLASRLHWPAHGQEISARRRVGVLQVPSAGINVRTEALRQGMRELGWVEGKNVEYLFAFADGDVTRLDALARMLIAQRAEVIVCSSGVSTRALQRATKTIPIVMVTVANPVANGFVASLARPGGNVTGLSNQQEDVLGKLVDLLHELVPAAQRIAVLVNENNPSQAALWAAAQRACAALRLAPTRVVASAPEQLAGAVAQITSQRAQAVVVIADPMYTNELERIHALMLPARLPVAYGLREHVAVGGLLSYGVNFTEQWRHAAKFVDRILNGARPADLPVEQPTRFELVLNLKAARALGITIPRSLLLRADEVIE